MGNYYCLVSGLPDVAFDGSKVHYSVERFRDEIYPQLTSDDTRLVDLFFLSRDNANILQMLEYGVDAPLKNVGVYKGERLAEIIASAKDGDIRDIKVPAYIYDFLDFYFANEEKEGYVWSDILSAHYYEYAMSVSNKFLSGWFEYNLNVNNILVALLARKYKLNVSESVVGNNAVSEALRTSNARDFGLSGSVDYFEALVRLNEDERLHERERRLDEMRWAWLEDNSVFNYFTVEKLYVFLQKLDIIERWAIMDADKGMEQYNSMIEDLKSGAVFTDAINNENK